MTFAETENRCPARGIIEPAGPKAPKTGTVGQLRLFLGAAALLLLVALAALAAPSQAPGPETGLAASQTGSGPTFDGRGKWTGY